MTDEERETKGMHGYNIQNTINGGNCVVQPLFDFIVDHVLTGGDDAAKSAEAQIRCVNDIIRLRILELPVHVITSEHLIRIC